MEQTFRGSGICKETFAALAESYSDFAQIYKDLNNAAELAKGNANSFKEVFFANLSDSRSSKSRMLMR